MNYAELVAYLEQNWIKSAGAPTVDQYPFEEMAALLAARGDPQRGLRIVHVTGSKGKGSITTFAAALLRAHGLPTGTFTSPHLVGIEERIGRADGAPIDREELAARITDLMDASARLGHDPRSMLRLSLLAALEHWRETGTRYAAVEVSMGGRYDLTNVLEGQVAAVAWIGLEHVPRLGRSTAEIAAQKVAIVKPGRTCVSAPQPADVAAVLRAGIALAGGRLVQVEAVMDQAAGPVGAGFRVRATDPDGVVADLATPYRRFDAVRIGRLGRHQAENAAVALCAAEELLASAGRRLDEAAVRTALAGSAWPGRIDLLRASPRLLYDGAHTAESAAALARALAEHFPGQRWSFVVGLLTRRDAAAMLRAFASVGQRAVAVPVPGFEAMAPEAVARQAAEAGLAAATAPSVAEALRGLDGPVCVTGTLYLYAETLRALGRPVPAG